MPDDKIKKDSVNMVIRLSNGEHSGMTWTIDICEHYHFELKRAADLCSEVGYGRCKTCVHWVQPETQFSQHSLLLPIEAFSNDRAKCKMNKW